MKVTQKQILTLKERIKDCKRQGRGFVSLGVSDLTNLITDWEFLLRQNQRLQSTPASKAATETFEAKIFLYRCQCAGNRIYIQLCKQGKCCHQCGETRTDMLTFHHRDPKQKSFNIGAYGNHTWEEVEVEITKCDLLCTACHQELHGLLTKINY